MKDTQQLRRLTMYEAPSSSLEQGMFLVSKGPSDRIISVQDFIANSTGCVPNYMILAITELGKVKLFGLGIKSAAVYETQLFAHG